MINILLEAYIAKAKIKRKIPWVYMIIAITTMLSSIVFLFLYGFNGHLASALFLLLSVIALYVDIALWERKNLKQYKTRFEEHNKRLDIIRDILKDFSYGDNQNWYSSPKIQYLIQSGESSVEERRNSNIRLLDLGKTMVFPIIAFVAGVISDNAKLDEVFAIAFIALLVLVIFTSFSKISSFITDLLFKSSSINEMNILILLLKDLHLRDFD
jgi:hypothetical protein